MTPLLKRALDQAAVWHRGQKRKYPRVDVPYVSHLAGVALILAQHGFDEEVVAAGALHDAIEDAGVTAADIAALFGPRVSELVVAVTEPDKSRTWEDRKRGYLEQFCRNPWEAQAITIADKIDNFESIVVCATTHGDPWAMFKRGRDVQMAGFENLRNRILTLPPHSIIDAFEAAYRDVIQV
ncbi:HD domain-containing protein [Polyangium aurulentum]|uniref:HD domain-containing protein n=1 Tax=Polyangium aurulentum TaxID=2567896 RepID=UPI0010AE2698|nr:HD domain-containing protein [Polyangium aurulentum]UQA61679.1 HD domain-containing protein [Polyangium aurulentum]